MTDVKSFVFGAASAFLGITAIDMIYTAYKLKAGGIPPLRELVMNCVQGEPSSTKELKSVTEEMKLLELFRERVIIENFTCKDEAHFESLISKTKEVLAEDTFVYETECECRKCKPCFGVVRVCFKWNGIPKRYFWCIPAIIER